MRKAGKRAVARDVRAVIKDNRNHPRRFHILPAGAAAMQNMEITGIICRFVKHMLHRL